MSILSKARELYTKRVKPNLELIPKGLNENVPKVRQNIQTGLNKFQQERIMPVAAKVQTGYEKLAQKPTFTFANNQPNIAKKLLLTIPQETMNIPYKIAKASTETGTMIRQKDYTPQRLLSSAGYIAEPLVDVATLGPAGQTVKSIGKETLKTVAKQGAKVGAKFGAGYGAIGAFQQGKDIKDPKLYVQNLANQMLKGGAMGAVAGGTLAGGAYVGGKAVGKVAKDVKAMDRQGSIDLGATTGKKAKAPSLQEQSVKVPQQTSLEQGMQSPVKTQDKTLVGGSSVKSINPTDPYFNVERLNVSKGAKQGVAKVVEEVKPQIEQVVGKKLSNKEAVDFANSSSKTLHKVVTRTETLEWEAKMLKARQQLAQQAKDGTLTQDYIDNLMAIKSQGTDIARKLQSLSIGADPKQVTAKDTVLEAILKVTDDADKILKEAQGVDFNNFEQASSFYRKFVKPTTSDWLDKIRYSSMLSSPNTHIFNASSNYQGTGIVAPIEKTITGTVDFLKSKVTGKPREYYAGEGVEYAKGYYSKLHDASHNFLNVMRGKSFSNKQELYNLPLTEKGTKGRVAEDALSFFPRILQAGDEFFQTLTRGGVEKSLKYRASKGTKVTGAEMQAEREALKRLFNAPFDLKEEGHVLKAIEYLPKQIMEARNSNNALVKTVAKYTFPFVRIPSNILKSSVEYSPVGVSTMWGATNKTEQFSKALMGTAVGIGSAMLIGADRMTWAEPTDPKKKAAFRAAGFQPYSVKIGDKWISYAKLHPAISFNLALMSAVREAEKNKQLDDGQIETVLNGLAKWVNFYADMSYVKNIGDIVGSAKGDVEGITRYFANYPQQLVPFRALLGWVARIVDPVQRRADPNGNILDKQLQQLATQIPFLSKKTPARLDTRGQPIKNQLPVLNALSPARVTQEKPENMQAYREAMGAKFLYKYWKTLDPVIANTQYRELKLRNPQLASYVEKEKLYETLQLSGLERKMLTMEVGASSGYHERANAIAVELKKLKTSEEKNSYIKKLKEAKIITDDVYEQLKEMRDNGQL